MEDATRLLKEHPYAILFCAVLAEQIGLPMPAVLFLMAAGAIAAMGVASWGLLLVTGIAATLLADLVWYRIGWRRGSSVGRLITRISPNPDGLARRVWSTFQERGDRVLLWAKFVPGLSAITTPLAGATRMPLPHFLTYDGAGTVAWNGSFLAIGFVLGPELGRVAKAMPEIGPGTKLVVALAIASVMVWKLRRTPRQDAGAQPAATRTTLTETASALVRTATLVPVQAELPECCR